MLQFLGRNSAFLPDQNCAFFIHENSLVLLDCAMSAMHRLIQLSITKEIQMDAIEDIKILVTHTHGDHVGGIPMLIHYAFYIWKKQVTVAAPSDEVSADLKYLIERLEGCDPASYWMVPADTLPFIKAVIPTDHTPTLSGRCFGYCLDTGTETAVYTGDTNTLLPFLPYVRMAKAKHPDRTVSFYTEAAIYRSPVHIALKEVLPTLTKLAEDGVRVYLMHLDNEEEAAKVIEGTGIRLAPLI